jgi:septum site-determining protein MinD
MAPKIIAIGSGKGGVGKTTIALNLGFAIASLNKKTLVIDTDVTLPNLDLYTGLEKPMITLLEVLNGLADIKSAIYMIEMGLNILPCGSSLQALQNVDIEKLESVISEIRNSEYEYIILDVSAGLSKFSLLPMKYADEVLIVVNPEPASISDAQKVIAASALAGNRVSGIIVNKYKKGIYEDIGVKLGHSVVGIIPEDGAIIKARNAKKPLVLLKPRSSSARSMMRLANRICGIPPKKSSFRRLFR